MTGGTPPAQPDLAALREKAEKIRQACPCCNPFGDEDGNDAAAQQILAVLSLVDDLRAALTYVGEFARAHHHQQPAHVLLHSLTIDIPELVERALAGSPADTKEATDG